MSLRSPLALVVINGAPIAPESVSVTQSRDKNSDTFHADVPMAMVGNLGADNITAQVYMGNDGDASTLMFDGYVDASTYAFERGVVSLSGRDKVKKMIDKKTRKDWKNKQPHEVVQELGGAAGLSVQASSVGEKLGKIYQIDFKSFMHDVSDWSMVQKIADHFGMECFASVGKLFFQEMGQSQGAFTVQYVPPTPYSYADGTFITLSGSNNHVVKGGATVKVSSWNHKQKQANSASAGSGTTLYNYSVPGISQSQAQRIANKKHKEHTSHGKTISTSMPGDTSVNATIDLVVSGTGTDFDDTYQIQTVEHSMSAGEGYRMNISAKIKGG